MDDPNQTAFELMAPPDERYDANAELAKAHSPLASELIPAENLRPVIDYITDQYEANALNKGGIIQFPGRSRPNRPRGPQSVVLDELQIFAHGDYWDKPSPLGFDGLRQMVEQTPILNSIILTRIRQISRFTAPQEDDGPGFVIRHVDKTHKMTSEEEESTKLLSRFITNCGWEFNPRRRKRLKRDSFTQFVAKMVRDSLTMDSAPIETEMKHNRKLGIDGFYAVDGSTIRLCSEDGYQGDDEIFALQVIQGRIVSAYGHEDLIYEPRNPRTDVRLAGYGLGETELLIRVVTGFLNAMTYNIKGFDENSIPKGLLTLFGDYDTNDLTAFKRYWSAMVKGVNNQWTLPVLAAKDKDSGAQFTPFNVEFNEMYFSKWMTFLTSIATAIYGMDPAEINFESFSASKSSLSGNDTAEKLAASQDKGLRPMMSYMESLISDFIISDFSDKFVFRWAGLDEEDQEKRHELKKLSCTVDEIRAEEGRKAIGGVLGGAPLNPSLIGIYQAEQQPQGEQEQEDYGQVPEGEEQEENPEEGGDFGDGDADGDATGEDQSEDLGQSSPNEPEGDFGKAFPTIYSVE